MGSWENNAGGSWAGKPAIKQLAPKRDTGLVVSQRSIVLNSIVAMLQRLTVGSGAYLQAAEATSTMLRGTHDEDGLALLWDQVRGRLPAILVAVGDKEYKPASTTRRIYLCPMHVHIYFIDQSLRGRMSRVAGDVQSVALPGVADPGIFLMMEHVEELLAGETPGDVTGSIKVMRPTRETQLNGDNEIEIWHQQYEVEVTRNIRANRDLSLEITTIQTQHQAPGAPANPVITQDDDV